MDKISPGETRQALADQTMQLDARTRDAILRIQQEIALVDRDLDGVMLLIAERALMLTPGTGAEVELMEGDLMVCRATAGVTARTIGQVLRRDASLSGQALSTGTTLICDDAETDGRVDRATCRELGARSLIAAPLRVGDQLIGALKVLSNQPHTFSARDSSSLQLLVETLGVTIEHHRLAEKLRKSGNQYRLLFEHNPLPMWVSEDKTRRLLAVNRAMVAHYGYGEAELLSMTARDLWVEDVAQAAKRLEDIPHPARIIGQLQQHRKKDGSVIDVEVSTDSIDFGGQPARLGLALDVSERMRTERDLQRVSRAQKLLSACNEALIRATSEQALLNNICEITVDIGGYRMAWVGFAMDDAGKTVRPMARAGEETSYLDDLAISWCDTKPTGLGPAGRSIRSGNLVIVEDVRQDPSFQPWLSKANVSGFRSVVCLPLGDGVRTFGLFYLYAAEIAHISADEIQLLQQLAADLAFGIYNLRAQEEQRRVQSVMLKVAVAVSASTGDAFFEQLAHHMVEALGAQGGLVSRLVPGDPPTARSIAAVAQGRLLEDFDYALAGSPCDAARHNGGNLVVSDGLAKQFPQAGLPDLPNPEAYVGCCLLDSSGQAIGFISAFFRNALAESDFIVSTLQIFAARASAEMERQASDAHIRHQASLLDKAQDAILVRNLKHEVVYWNKSAERLYGWTADEVRGVSLVTLLYADSTAFLAATEVVNQTGEWTGEIQQQRRDGSMLTVEGRWTLVKDEQGQAISILSINTDVSARKAAEQEIQKLAFYDPLTRLPNRLMLMDRLEHALASSTRTGMGGALLFIDLDNFKTLNDTLGHAMGDLLLQEVAERLSHSVREVDTVARLGGDEFVVMLENLGTNADVSAPMARTIGEKILNALHAPYLLAGNEHQSTASIGIAPFNDHRISIGDLLKQADIAMYQAKAAGRNTLRFFDPDLQAAVTARAALDVDLRQALVQQQFVLHYQPQFDTLGRVIGAEALVRWRHPHRGQVSPATFIPLAEETGLILPLGRWVLTEACRLLARWEGQRGKNHLTLAVNVSARQFRQPDFAASVIAALMETRANPLRLKLELTESLLLDDLDATVEKMNMLKASGVNFSLDDFGTGYSSLSYLKRLPLDQLKIDQSFVRDVLTDPNDATIARTIIALGRALGLSVMAEGVETQAQWEFLASHSCDAYQGYLFSRPMPEDKLDEFLRQHRVAH